MAKATTARFSEFVLEVEWTSGSGIYTRICGMNDVSFNRVANVDSTEVPDCDDESTPYEVEKEVRSIELTISASGVWARESHQRLLQWFYSGASLNARIGHLAAASGDTDYEGGPCLLTNLTNARSKGQKVSASIELAFSGFDASLSGEAILDPWDGGSPVPDFAGTPNLITVSGTVSKDTTKAKFGEASYLGGGGHMEIADSEPLVFGADDFTIEMWVARSTEAGISGFFSQWGDLGEKSQRLQYDPASNQFQWIGSADGDADSWEANYDFDTTGSFTPSSFWDGTFRHICVNRRAGVVTIYVEGVAGATTAAIGSSALYEGATHPILIGARHSVDTVSRNAFDGNIDEVRVSVGRARYTGPFTPRTKPFPHSLQGDPYFASTKLLCDFE